MQKINWKNNTLSKLCLGTVQFGIDYGIANSTGKVEQEEVNKILEYVISEDINCFDTAKAYGNSESVIGSYLNSRERLDDINIISKIKSDQILLSYEALRKEIDYSLSKIATEKLFGLLLHDSSALYQWDDKFSEYIKRLKFDNLIDNFGVSIYTDEEFKLAIENDSVEIIQIPYSLFDQRAVFKNWFEIAKGKNKLIFIRSVYLQGVILMNSNDVPSSLEKVKPYLSILDIVCKDLNISRNELALSFVNNTAPDSILLFGCDDLSQAKENIHNFNNLIDLDSKVINYLQEEFSSIDEKIYNPTKWNIK